MRNDTLLIEIAAEVCYKMGGIHTVISTKAAYAKGLWGNNYFLLGAYMGPQQYDDKNFQPVDIDTIPVSLVRKTIQHMNENGFSVHVGIWKIDGDPLILLLDPMILPDGFDAFKSDILRRHSEAPPVLFIVEAYLRFGFCVYKFFETIDALNDGNDYSNIIAHYHEYMAAVSLRRVKELGVRTVFTTHGTVVGRYLSAVFPDVYQQMMRSKGSKEIELPSPYHRFCERLEHEATLQAHIFTTVSEPMAMECYRFLGRDPDIITPSGLNISNIKILSHSESAGIRGKIDELVQGHFFKDKRIASSRRFYFFTSGRYEYTVKGYDVTISALERLNDWIKAEKLDITVVMFFITDTPLITGSPLANKTRYVLNQIMSVTRNQAAGFFLHKVPSMFYNSDLVRDLQKNKLNNTNNHRVKVIYYPQFISMQSPVLKMEYMEFIGAFDLGVFPSLYEPWGYAPIECISAGTPALTTNVSGFGDYVQKHTSIGEEEGVFVLDRHKDDLPGELFEVMKQKIQHPEKIHARMNRQTNPFDWSTMISAYSSAYLKASTI